MSGTNSFIRSPSLRFMEAVFISSGVEAGIVLASILPCLP